MLDDNQVFRKVLGGLFALLVFVLLVTWIYQFLTMASLTVTTNSTTDYVSIAAVKNGVEDTTSNKQGQHKLSARIKPGVYEITAFNKSFSVTKIIKIKARQTLSFAINPVTTTTPEPVYGNSVSGVVADSTHLLFLDSTNSLTSIDASNNVSTVFAGQALFTAKWASPLLGLARDSNNNIYVINNNAVSPLGLPFSATQSSTISYDISRSNQVYVSNGKGIYLGDTAGKFKKIYTSSKTVVSISAGINKVSAIEIANRNTGDAEGSIVTVNNSGVSLRSSVIATALMWSPDGKYLLAIGEPESEILDTNLNQVSAFPTANADSFAWKDGQSLFYSQGGALFLYSPGSQQSQKLAVMPAQGAISGIYPSGDGSYVYVSGQIISVGGSDTGNTQLFKIGLKNQPVNSSAVALSVFLPETVSYCLVNYVNYTEPTITIEYPSTASYQNCLSMLQGEIKTYGLDPNKFQYKFIPQSVD